MTFFIESLGCAKNQVDSEQMIAALEQRGLRWVLRPEEAEIILVNTCGFITSAKEESIQTSLELKERFPHKKVIMAGCLVQRYGEELQRAMKEIDGFVGLGSFAALADLALTPAKPEPEARSSGPPPRRSRKRFLSFPGSVYVKVAEGCSNRCSYCAIPLIRGPLQSRDRGDVLEEIAELLDRGVFEIILIAQDLASYGRDRGEGQLGRLLEEISGFKGRFWLRLLYLHPDHFPLELLDIMAGDPRLLPYFDIPFQHAAEALLGRMGRRGSAESYLQLVRDIRTRLPEAVIRSTFLVGFPAESQQDVEALLEFQRLSELDWAGVFSYSREEGTPAYGLGGRVRKGPAEERKRLVEQAQIPITEKRLDRQVGRILEVLVEEAVEGEDLHLARAYLQAPEVDGLVVVRAGGLKPGGFYRVKIERRIGIDLEAVLVR